MIICQKERYKSIYFNERNIQKDKLFTSKFKATIKEYNSRCFASMGKSVCYIYHLSEDKQLTKLFKIHFIKNSDNYIIAQNRFQKISKKAMSIIDKIDTEEKKIV